MLPLHLTMKGFLSFKEKTEIDFTKLYEDTIYLITGPTGSGKTSIFDAITFALFGEASSDERSKTKSYRSHLIDEDEILEVVLKFSQGKDTYVIKRSQKSNRSITSSLFKVGEEEIIYSKANQIKEKIDEILGLNISQFKKIIMLPQGEFRNFLVASSNDKSEILKKLFDTEKYESIKFKIKNRFDSLFSKMKINETIIDSEKSILENSITLVNNKDIIEEFNKELCFLKQQSESIIKDIENFENKIKVIENSIEKTIENNIKVQKLNNLTLILNEHLTKEKEYISKKDDLSKIEEIRFLFSMEDKIKEDEITYKKNHILLNNLIATQKQNEIKYREANEKYIKIPTIREEISCLQIKSENLNNFIIKKKEANDLISKLKEERTLLENLLNKYIPIDELIKIERDLNQDSSKIKDKISLIKDNISNNYIKYKELESYSKSFFEKLDLEKLIGADKDNLIELKNKIVQLEKNKDKLVKQIELSINVYELQGVQSYRHLLKNGEPCPLCGQIHNGISIGIKNDLHLDESEKEIEIKKDNGNESIITKEEINILNEKLNEIEKKLISLKNKETSLNTKIEMNSLRVSEVIKEINFFNYDFKHKIEIETKLNEINNMILKDQNALEISNNELILVSRKLSEVLQKIKDNEILKKEIDLKSNSLKIMESKLNTIFEDENIKEKSIEELIDEKNIVLQEITKNNQKIESITKVYELVKDSVLKTKEKMNFLINTNEEISLRLNENKNIFNIELSSKNIDKEKFIYLYEVNDDFISIKKEVDLYFNTLLELNTQIKSIKEDIKVEEIVDTKKLEEEKGSLVIEVSSLKEDLLKIRKRETILESSYKKIQESIKFIEDNNEQYKTLKLLLEITTKGHTFENYVLSYYLDGVILNANKRLKKMTQDRFILIRNKNEKEYKNQIQGLNLNIFDSYTNQEREVGTLSGGESFKASLAMALGLSDFISQNRVGNTLDTIFIDEGFGTLDMESLDIAMETLMDLSSLGRKVAIISHVEELKERITSKILVENNGPQGSMIKIKSHII